MNLIYLRYFYDSARYESMTIAARKNNVSQSAVSQGIAKLEMSLQTPLTTHQKQKFQLTEEGEIVFNEARNVFALVNQIKDKLNEFKGDVSGELKFVTTNALAQFYMPPAYLLMKKTYPKVQIKFHRGGLNFIHESLRNKSANFALVLDSPEFESYSRIKISEGHFHLYKMKNLGKDTGVLVDHMKNDEVLELRERYKEHYGKDLEIVDALSGWALVSTFMQMGHGAGYLPEFVVQNVENLEKMKLKFAPIKYSISVIKLKSSPFTRAEKAFLEIVKNREFIQGFNDAD